MVIVKEIENLSELDGFEWSHNGRVLCIRAKMKDRILVKLKERYIESRKLLLALRQRDLIDLEFLGLKIKILEKPKITKEEKILLDKLFFDNEFIARDKDGSISIYPEEPLQRCDQWYMDEANNCTRLINDSFKFITWESGKAWTKEELLKLEVME